MVVNPVAIEQVIPGGGFHVFAPIFVPFDIGFVAQDARAFFTHVRHGEEGANVQAHAVIDVRVPADGLSIQRFPADKDVMGSFTRKDQLQLFLEGFGSGKAFARTVNAVLHILLLAAYPVAHIGVGEGFQIFVIQLMVVDQSGKAVAQAVPDMPDEGAMLKELAVLGKELFAQPGFQRFARVVSIGKQGGKRCVCPLWPVCGHQQIQQAVGGSSFSAHRGNAHNAVSISMGQKSFAPLYPLALFFGQFHVFIQFSGPAIAEQAGHSHMQHRGVLAQRAVGCPFGVFIPNYRATGVPVKNPLGGVIGIGLRQAVGVFFGGNGCPVVKVKGDFDKGSIGDVKLLVYPAHGNIVFWGGTKTPNGGEVRGVVGDDGCYVLMEAFLAVMIGNNTLHPMDCNAMFAKSFQSLSWS